MLKKSLLIGLLVLVTLLLRQTSVLGETEISAGTFDQLRDAFENDAHGSNVRITLTDAITVTGQLTVRSGCSYYLDGASKTLSRGDGYQGVFFNVPAGTTLDLYRVSLNGGGVSGVNVMVYVDGTLYATRAAFDNNIRSNSQNSNGGAIFAGGNANLAFSDVTFTGNKAYRGGAIYASGADTVTIRDGSALNDNEAYHAGGAVYATCNRFNLFSSKAENNKAAESGGGLYLQGGTGTLNDATLSDNEAKIGGGAAFDRCDSVVLAASCKITGNTASGQGGGLYADATSVTLGGGCEISGNSADLEGGGAWISGKSLRLASNASIRDNTATGDGGGVWMNSAALTMAGTSSIADNRGANGGGAYLSGGSASMTGSAAISNNTVTGDQNGGGIFLSDAALTMADQTVISGNTGLYGAGCYCKDGSVTMTDSAKISANKGKATAQITGTTGGGIELKDKATLTMKGYASICDNVENINLGGGLYIGGDAAAVFLSENASIRGNEAKRGGGILMSWEGSLSLSGNASVRDNHAREFAGGIWTNRSPRIALSGAPRIIGNTAGSTYAADNCYCEGSGAQPAFVITGNLSFGASIGVNNRDSNKESYVFAKGANLTDADGARFTYDGQSKYIGVANTAKTGLHFSDGGHPILIYVNGQYDGKSSHWWSNLDNAFKDFVNGSSRDATTFTIRLMQPLETGSRPTYEIPSGVTVTLTGANITSKRTGGDKLFTVQSGGKLILDGVTIDGQSKGDTGSTLVDVKAGGTLEMINGASLEHSGGNGISASGKVLIDYGRVTDCLNRGIYISATGEVTLRGNALIQNNAGTSGGGIYNLNVLNIQGGYITGNTATNGGGVYNTGTLTMTGGSILDNTATEDGGGVYSTGTMTVNGANAVVSGNQAVGRFVGDGGGVCIEDGTLTVTQGYFSDNTAGCRGGGLYLNGTSHTFGKGAEVCGNSAQNDGGGGVYVRAGTLSMSGKLYDNTAGAGGGGLYFFGTTATLWDEARVYDNRAHNGGGILVNGVAKLTLYGDVYNNKATVSGGGLYVAQETSLQLTGSYQHTGGSGKSAKVYGNTAEYAGGGLWMGGDVTMDYDAAVTENRAPSGSGIYIAAYGDLSMRGRASVTGNTASGTGGVYLDKDVNASISVADSARIEGNLLSGGGASNLYLPDGKTVDLKSGPYGRICLTPETLPESEAVVATYANNASVNPLGFSLDQSADDYFFYRDGNSVKLKKITPPTNEKIAVEISGMKLYWRTLTEVATDLNTRLVSGVSKATLSLLGNLEVDTTFTVPSGATLDFVGNGYSLTRKSGFAGHFIEMADHRTLNLVDITLDGSGVENAQALVYNHIVSSGASSGTLTMTGVSLQNNTGAALQNEAHASLGADTAITGNASGVTGLGTLYLSDNVRITGNGSGNDKKNVRVKPSSDQTILLSGALTGTGMIGVNEGDMGFFAKGDGAYSLQPSDADHFAWDGTPDEKRFMLMADSNTPPIDHIARSDAYIQVDDRYFRALGDAFNYVNTAGRYENGREATVTLLKGVYINYSAVPTLDAGRVAVLTDGGNNYVLKRGVDHPTDSYMIDVAGSLTLADNVTVSNEDTNQIKTATDPAIHVQSSGQLRMRDDAKIVLNEKNTDGDVKNEGSVVLQDRANIDGTLVGAGSLSVSGDIKILNAHVPNGQPMIVAGALSDGASIGVTPSVTPTAKSPVTIARSDDTAYPTGLTASDAKRFAHHGKTYKTLYDAADKAALLGTSDGYLSVAPERADFGDVIFGETPTSITMTVTNRNLESAENVSATLTDPNHYFEVLTNLPSVLAAGASAPLTIRFKADLPFGNTYAVDMRIADEYGALDTRASVRIVLPFDNDKLDRIEVCDQPDKMVYQPGEQLDLTGLTVTLTGTNGKSATGLLSGLAMLNPTATPAEGTVLRLRDDGTTVEINIQGKTAQTEKLTVYIPESTYPVTVNGGRGGGRYVAKATVTLTADDPAPGMRFINWRVDDGGAVLADPEKPVTTFAMPPRAVTVTAVFEDDYTPVTGIRMIEARTMIVGDAAYLAAQLAPSEARLRDLIWVSSDPETAHVTEDGLVRALKPGFATITGTSRSNPDVYAACEITVTAGESEGEPIYSRDLTLVKGEKMNLDPRYGWSSDQPDIARVNAKGRLVAKAPGVATVRGTLGVAQAKSALVGDQIILRVTVVKKGEKMPETPALLITPDVRTQKVGEVTSLTAQVSPINHSLAGLAWTSADPAVASVDDAGRVTGVSAGETTVTATLGALSATARIVVEEETADETLTLTVDFLAVAKDKRIKLNNLTGYKGSWAVADPKIAAIGKAGVLKTLKTGETTLTFTVARAVKKSAAFMGKSLLAGDSVRIALHVTGAKKAVKKIKVQGEKAMLVGETQALAAVLTPKNPKFPQVFWRSDNPAVASVDDEGNVTAHQPGKAAITATASSGVSHTIAIHVS